ncbi:MAG: hypothetical protein CVV22_04050 [Ignavibacteriae bacterium HGW-Ignavibacteriae-1]|jgi:hypothetical protein|nr:MAG: hypothetical protein CVV22_04050 [Ignavibacteriae bacterium HGW-Ignavibacteriae-1]
MIKYIFIFLILASNLLNSQIRIDSAFGKIGQSTEMAITISPELLEQNINIEGQFTLSNPTVFFPDSVTTLAIGLECSLTRLNEFDYEFAVSGALSGDLTDSLNIFIVGELLAGYDSVCVLHFEYIKVGSNTLSDLSGIVVSESIGTPLPYVRRSVLSLNYPNPIFAGESTEWAYKIDLPSQVRFIIYDLNGKVYKDIDLGIVPAGAHKFELHTNPTFAAGAYLIHFISPSASNKRMFMVIK